MTNSTQRQGYSAKASFAFPRTAFDFFLVRGWPSNHGPFKRENSFHALCPGWLTVGLKERIATSDNEPHTDHHVSNTK